MLSHLASFTTNLVPRLASINEGHTISGSFDYFTLSLLQIS